MTQVITLQDFLSPQQYAEKHKEDPKLVKKIMEIAHRHGVSAIISATRRPIIILYGGKNRKKTWLLRPEADAQKVFNKFFKTQKGVLIGKKITNNVERNDQDNLKKVQEMVESPKHKNIKNCPTNGWGIYKFTDYYFGQTAEERKFVRKAMDFAYETSVKITISDEDYNIVFKNSSNGFRIRPEVAAHNKLLEIVKQIKAKEM